MKKHYRINWTQFAAFMTVTIIAVATMAVMFLIFKDMYLHPEHAFTTYRGY